MPRLQSTKNLDVDIGNQRVVKNQSTKKLVLIKQKCIVFYEKKFQKVAAQSEMFSDFA